MGLKLILLKRLGLTGRQEKKKEKRERKRKRKKKRREKIPQTKQPAFGQQTVTYYA